MTSSAYTFEEYQLTAASTAIYPGAGTGDVLALAYLGLGLGEAGEVQGKLKKVLRDDNGTLTPEKRQAILDECGDVLWYLANLVSELGAGLEDVAAGNAEKLASRKARGVLTGSGDTR